MALGAVFGHTLNALGYQRRNPRDAGAPVQPAGKSPPRVAVRNGIGVFTEYKLVDSRKAPFGFQRMLQFLAPAAFLFCLTYCSNIQQELQHRYGLHVIMAYDCFSNALFCNKFCYYLS